VKNKIIYLLLITLLITNCVMLFMLIKKPHERNLKGKKGNFLMQKLKLDETQEKEFLVLDELHREAMRNIDDAILKSRKKLFNSFDSSMDINESLVLKIGSLVSEKEREVFSFFSKVKVICNEKQVEDLEEVIKNAIINSSKKDQRPEHNRNAPPHHNKGMQPPPPGSRD